MHEPWKISVIYIEQSDLHGVHDQWIQSAFIVTSLSRKYRPNENYEVYENCHISPNTKGN